MLQMHFNPQILYELILLYFVLYDSAYKLFEKIAYRYTINSGDLFYAIEKD
jgi:hypothetical protein